MESFDYQKVAQTNGGWVPLPSFVGTPTPSALTRTRTSSVATSNTGHAAFTIDQDPHAVLNVNRTFTEAPAISKNVIRAASSPACLGTLIKIPVYGLGLGTAILTALCASESFCELGRALPLYTDLENPTTALCENRMFQVFFSENGLDVDDKAPLVTGLCFGAAAIAGALVLVAGRRLYSSKCGKTKTS